MALLNPTFADAGALPGEAARWTISAVTSLEVLAAFGGAGREDFERWSAFLAALADVTLVRAFFGRDGFEAFERPFLFALPTGRVVVSSFGVRDVETWARPSPWLDDWSRVPSTLGLLEPFARSAYLADWSSVGDVAAPLEIFSGAWARAATL
ncbi:MAG: hypothetical protein INH37_20940 [Myxococcaceae bacterium]|nr:hypothetical protein [Myxococcaceae bacterium]